MLRNKHVMARSGAKFVQQHTLSTLWICAYEFSLAVLQVSLQKPENFDLSAILHVK